MKVFYSEQHRRHFPQGEIYGGEFVTPFERPSRMEYILRRLQKRQFNDIVKPGKYDPKPVLKIHDKDFVKFLKTGWQQWIKEGYSGEMLPTCFPARRMQQNRCPKMIDGQIGYYALAMETAITAGTWDAAQSSAAVVQAAQKHVAQSGKPAFALCRPPGHHAAKDMYGGYCFLNNAAIAAQMFRDQGAKRVAILDVDFHHGNGTQDIFYNRKDVLFVSLHGHPEDAFPHFLGYADETGHGKGEGYNLNLPMRPGTSFSTWNRALAKGLKAIKAYGPDALVISLGVDTYLKDPISFFKLDHDDFTHYGNSIAKLKLPTMFVMEGGYAVEEIGINTVNVLEGFINA